MTLLTPYVIDGAQHPAAVFRRQLQYALGDGSGVARPGDFKVLPLNQPGRGVRISAGGVIIQSRESETAARETYGVENDGEFEFFGGAGSEGIPGTGSGETRRDMIVVEIRDPEMAGVPEPSDWDAAEFSRIRVLPGVPAGVTRVEDLTNPAYANLTAYCLAVIVWPASTTTITSGMIVDTREVQSPREKIEVRGYGISDALDEAITATSPYPGGEHWPDAVTAEGRFRLDIPKWATQMTILIKVAGVVDPSGGASVGWFWCQVGRNDHPNRVSTEPKKWQKAVTTSASRGRTLSNSDTRAVPASMRGTAQTFFPRATRTSGTNATSLKADNGSDAELIVVFREVAV